MTIIYGLTSKGYVSKPQSVIIQEQEDILKSIFGNNINLAPSSNFGQLVGAYSEREALIWQLGEAVYASQYPNGAEGTSVDNVLSLNNMRRNKAVATKTNPTAIIQDNGITKYGLVVKGSPGTLIDNTNIVQTDATPPLQFKIDADITIQASINAIQGIYLSNIPISGKFSLVMPNTVISQDIQYNALPQKGQLKFDLVPTTGAYTISLTCAGATLATASIAYNSTAAQIQIIIRALSGYSSVIVTGDYTAGFEIDFLLVSNPLITIATNTTDATITPIDSIQAAINNIIEDTLYPYTDATVIVSSQGYAVTFGNGYLVSGQISCSGQPIALIEVNTNTMQDSTSITNIKIINSTQGANAQGVGTATCISTGPNFVAAGSLNTIGTPIAGWNSIINELDCITGNNGEGDTEALTRRSENLQANANGPLQSMVSKVKAVADVLTAIGSENVFMASRQRIDFTGSSSSGSFKLSLDGNLTPAIAYNANSAAVQAAIRSVSGFEPALVTGDLILGLTIDFNGSLGGRELPLIVIEQNTTGLTMVISYGLPGKSFEIIVQGGDDTAIANAILGAKPAGMQSYGSTVITVFDDNGNSYNIGFSRPTAIPIYTTLVLVTDLLTSDNPQFNVSSINTIQQDIVDIGNAFGIGGLVKGFGSNGLIGSFNNIPGILNYTLYFGRTSNPTSNNPIQMQSFEVPTFETFLVSVSYT
jgi:hypothetical protein